jgi:hypothetical protein
MAKNPDVSRVINFGINWKRRTLGVGCQWLCTTPTNYSPTCSTGGTGRASS